VHNSRGRQGVAKIAQHEVRNRSLAGTNTSLAITDPTPIFRGCQQIYALLMPMLALCGSGRELLRTEAALVWCHLPLAVHAMRSKSLLARAAVGVVTSPPARLRSLSY